MRPAAVAIGAALYLNALYSAAAPPAPSAIAAAPATATARDLVEALNRELELGRSANTANSAPAASATDFATDVAAPAVAAPAAAAAVAALRGAAAAAVLDELAQQPPARRVALLCCFASRLLRREAALAARGRELLGAAAPEAAGAAAAAAVAAATAAGVSGEAAPAGVQLGEGQRRQAAGCLPLLLSHMATSPEQKART